MTLVLALLAAQSAVVIAPAIERSDSKTRIGGVNLASEGCDEGRGDSNLELHWGFGRRYGELAADLGEYWDAESDLHENGFRYYDPQSGRFLSTEPALQWSGVVRAGVSSVGQMNPYAYAGQNPIDRYDPDGVMEGVLPNALAGLAEGEGAGGAGLLGGSASGVALGGAATVGIFTLTALAIVHGMYGIGPPEISCPIPEEMGGPMPFPTPLAAKGGNNRLNQMGLDAIRVAKMFNNDPCSVLDNWMQFYKANKDTWGQAQVKFAQKLLGCRGSSYSNQ